MTVNVNGVDLSDRTVAYLETVLWAETVSLPVAEEDLVDGCMDVDEDNVLHGVSECEPLDDYFGIDDFTEESLRKAQADIDAWFEWIEWNGYTEDTEEYADDDRVAHDFWLTRNGHGAGYWDGDYGDELGCKLTGGAKGFGGQYVIVDEEGKLHLEG